MNKKSIREHYPTIHHRGAAFKIIPTFYTRPSGSGSWWSGKVEAKVRVTFDVNSDNARTVEYKIQLLSDGQVALVAPKMNGAIAVAPNAMKAMCEFLEFRDEWIARREGRWVEPAA